MPVAVKICGLTRPEDVEAAIQAGADALGFVLAEGSVQLSLDQARELLAHARASRPADRSLDTIAVVGRATQAEVDRALALGFDGVQVVVAPDGSVPCTQPAFLLPVFFDGPDLDERLQAWSAGLLEDVRDGVRGSINIDSAKGGGTGTRADWDRVASIAERAPVMLAGGLTPENVAQAIARVRPVAIDVSSGVEAGPRRKDPAKLHAFVRAAKAALP